MLRRIAYLLPQETKLFVYYAPIYLTYGPRLGASVNSRLKILQRLQNKTLRYIFWHEYRNGCRSTEALYRKFNTLKVNVIVRYEQVNHKIKRPLVNVNFTKPDNHKRHEYETSRRSFLQIPRIRTNYNRNSLFIKESIDLTLFVPIYNTVTIPFNLKSSSSNICPFNIDP